MRVPPQHRGGATCCGHHNQRDKPLAEFDAKTKTGRPLDIDPAPSPFGRSRADALDGKVGSEFAAPLCRGHLRERRRHGDERLWRRERQIDPEAIALALWRRSHPDRSPEPQPKPPAPLADPAPPDFAP